MSKEETRGAAFKYLLDNNVNIVNEIEQALKQE